MRNRGQNTDGARPTPRRAEGLARRTSTSEEGLARRSSKSEGGLARRSSKSEGGFTLLELLVAMTILAIMGTAVFTVFNQSTETWHRADARTRQFVAAREALDLMATELRQAMVAANASADYGAQFYGFPSEEVDPTGQPTPPWRPNVHPRCGEVYFVAPTQMRPEDADQDLCVIGYWVNSQRQLMRYCLSDDHGSWETLDPSIDTPHNDLNQQLGVHVVELNFEFWDEDDSIWNPEDEDRHAWNSEPDSPVLDQRNKLPRAVRITLVVWDPTLDEGADPDDPDVRKRLKVFKTVVRLNNAE